MLWWQAGTGYQVVLAPEGVAQASVHYEAFLAPVLLWTGASLLALRLWRLLLWRGRPGWSAARSARSPATSPASSPPRSRASGGA